MKFFVKTLSYFLIGCCYLMPTQVWAQEALATLKGQVKDADGQAFKDAHCGFQGTNIGSSTSSDGQFEFKVPSGTYTFQVGALGFENYTKKIHLKAGEVKSINVKLIAKEIALKTFEKKDDSRKTEAGTIYIDPGKAKQIAGPIGGIEGILKTLVGSTNELTSQYSVRGGNYDENLVYVNDFEIYRPFLVRSGQQEGLSFVNPDLTQGVQFSVGGFQAKYGDKMSSVLDVSYKKPTKFGGSAMASVLGASLHLEGATKNKKLTYLFGARQKSNQFLLKSQPTQGIYTPSFTDIQTLLHYQINPHWESELILNYARNRFSFIPQESTSSFGVLNKAYQLKMFYNGSEIDQFDSRFGGYSLTYRPNEDLKLKFLVSAFQTNEKETYDINGEYILGELETDLGKANFGQTKYNLGTGVIQDYARNYLKVGVITAAHRGAYSAGKHYIQWGADVTQLQIEDKLHQFQRRDSAGFTQPFSKDSLTMHTLYHASNNISTYRLAAFIQDNFKFQDTVKYTGSFGTRVQYNALNNELLFSPRIQLGFKPYWKKDFSFRFASGIYNQAPFYRELRDLQGHTNLQVKAQKSFHLVAGTEYNFKVGNSPFKFTSEFYYKNLWDLVPYEYDGIKIRYYGRNDGKGYAYGGELRLYADLVKDATSWISIGMMKTEERVLQHFTNAAGNDSAVYSAFIPRPTDQRLMIAMYFQDYLRQNKNFRVHLNLMYGTGLPFGPPDGNRVGDILRMPSYKRVDIGFSALLLDGSKANRPAYSYFKNFKSIWASVEIFNLLDIQNTLSYNWVQDQSSNKIFAVPNRLTSRMLNFKLAVEF